MHGAQRHEIGDVTAYRGVTIKSALYKSDEEEEECPDQTSYGRTDHCAFHPHA